MGQNTVGANATVAAIIGSLSWPLTVLLAVIILRDSVRKLLGRLISFKGAGQGLTFSEQLGRVEHRSSVPEEDAPIQEASEGGEASAATGVAPSQSRDDQALDTRKPDESVNLVDLARIAEVSPSGAILTAWQEVERACNSLYNVTLPRPVKTIEAKIERLYKAGLISPQLFERLNSLRRLRNVAVHGVEEVSAQEAIRFGGLAAETVDELDSLRAEVKSEQSYQNEHRKAVDRVVSGYGALGPIHSLLEEEGYDEALNLEVEGRTIKPIRIEVVYSPGVQRGHMIVSKAPRPCVSLLRPATYRDL